MSGLLTPRLLAQHLLVLLVVLGLVRLGVWQLDRLGEVRTRNAAAAARLEEPPVDVGTLLADRSLADTDELAGLEYRPVVATGTWRAADEVLQRGRARNGRSGYDVLTPLDLDDGGSVVVRRGWVPFDADLRPPVPDAAPPSGRVVVRGTLERSIPQPTGPVAQQDPDTGTLELVFNADLDRLSDQLGPVLPMLVRLEAQDPPPSGELPIPTPRPSQDEGTHLSYAVQWFAFAATAVGFYVVLLRRRLAAEAGDDHPDAVGTRHAGRSP